MTPNLDRLAERGALFTNAHTAAPLCNPSRVAVMSGLRPSTTGVYSNTDAWRSIDPRPVSLVRLFKNNGYRVAGYGKIYHDPPAPSEESAWDVWFMPMKRRPPPTIRLGPQLQGFSFGRLENAEEDMADYMQASRVIAELARERNRPLFLAYGIRKPHFPHSVPEKYFAPFPLEDVQLPQVLENDLDDVPPRMLPSYRKAYEKQPGRLIENIQRGAKRNPTEHERYLAAGQWRPAVQAYLATVLFVDAQIGRVIDALDTSGLANDTIVIVWSDHGYHRGEKQHWRKGTLWEEATRIPLIVVAPGITRPHTRINTAVDLTNLYPTLADLCGLSVDTKLDGVSLRPLLEDPDTEWTRPAITTMGPAAHAVRSAHWRYIRYADGAEELYDHRTDPNEWTNLASDPEQREVVARHARWLPEAE